MIKYKKSKYVTGFAIVISAISILIIYILMPSQGHLQYKYGVLEGGERYSNLAAINFELEQSSEINDSYKVIVHFNQALRSDKIKITLKKETPFQKNAFDNCDQPVFELPFSMVDQSSIAVALATDLEKGNYDINFKITDPEGFPAYLGVLYLGVGQDYSPQTMGCNR